MSSVGHLLARSHAVLARRDGQNETLMDLMIVLVGLAFFALLLIALLFVLRRARGRQQAQQQQQRDEESLPQYEDVKFGDGHNRHRLTITTPDGRSSVVIVNERPMLSDPSAPPHSPNNVPEIHITFPDEHDEAGRRKNGQVMVMRVGEANAVGLEPVRDDELPAYEKESSTGFYSIDMDQIGGLKEKDRTQFQ